jgi:hypothetical protein
MTAIGRCRPGLRPCLLAVLLAVLLAYGGLGHGGHSRLAADHAEAGHAIVLLCASLMVVAAQLVVARPAASARPVLIRGPLAYAAPSSVDRPRADARASPAWLQRFLS